MGLFDGMRDKLGFGSKPEWQDDAGYVDDGYDDGYGSDDGYVDGGTVCDDVPQDSGNVVSFDAYNPANFENVKISSDHAPRVASYDSLGSTSRSSSSPYGRSVGTSSSRSSYASSRTGVASPDRSAAAGRSDPPDPAFLDDAPSANARDVFEDVVAAAAGSDPTLSACSVSDSLGSDYMSFHRDPAARLEIISPTAYKDVEKVANAAKAGKSVVLVVTETSADLAKRVLDFTFGVASALNLNVAKVADRIFYISKNADELSSEEREYLKKRGVL